MGHESALGRTTYNFCNPSVSSAEYIDFVVLGVDQVVVHLPGSLPVTGIDEVLSVVSRPTEVHLQADVASVGEPLRLRVDTPGVAVLGPAVDIQHHRQVLALEINE